MLPRSMKWIHHTMNQKGYKGGSEIYLSHTEFMINLEQGG